MIPQPENTKGKLSSLPKYTHPARSVLMPMQIEKARP